METGVRSPFLRPAGLLSVASLQRIKDLGQTLTIQVRGAQRRVIGTTAFQGMAKLQQVALRILIVLQQLQQRIAEGTAQRFGNKGATTMPTDQQAPGNQFLNRFAQ